MMIFFAYCDYCYCCLKKIATIQEQTQTLKLQHLLSFSCVVDSDLKVYCIDSVTLMEIMMTIMDYSLEEENDRYYYRCSSFCHRHHLFFELRYCRPQYRCPSFCHHHYHRPPFLFFELRNCRP